MGRPPSSWHTHCVPSSALHRRSPAGAPRSVTHGADPFFAPDALCTHERADLTKGELRGARVSCPLHGARFDVRTGRVLSPPAFKPLQVFATRVRGDTVEVELGDGAAVPAPD